MQYNTCVYSICRRKFRNAFCRIKRPIERYAISLSFPFKIFEMIVAPH